jgi:hypothetical protein
VTGSSVVVQLLVLFRWFAEFLNASMLVVGCWARGSLLRLLLFVVKGVGD